MPLQIYSLYIFTLGNAPPPQCCLLYIMTVPALTDVRAVSTNTPRKLTTLLAGRVNPPYVDRDDAPTTPAIGTVSAPTIVF